MRRLMVVVFLLLIGVSVGYAKKRNYDLDDTKFLRHSESVIGLSWPEARNLLGKGQRIEKGCSLPIVVEGEIIDTLDTDRIHYERLAKTGAIVERDLCVYRNIVVSEEHLILSLQDGKLQSERSRTADLELLARLALGEEKAPKAWVGRKVVI